jgi:phage shock protein PspC (stress-responsive transcriptional regulator)
MKSTFYKMRKGKLVAGVCAGLADKFGWDLPLTRVLAALIMYMTGFGILLYILLAIFLPYKEDVIEEKFGTGLRRRKDADVVNDKSNDNDGWYW